MDFHPRHIEWIEARGLDPYLAARLGICTHRERDAAWIRIPYREAGREVNAKYRLTSEKRHRMEPGAPLVWWNLDCLEADAVREPSSPVIITEGEWDALAAMQAGFVHVLSVPNGAPAAPTDAELTPEGDAERWRFFWRGRPWTDRVARFVIATDADAPGQVLASELVRRLGVHRCLFVTYPTGCKDLGDVLLECGVAGVVEVIGGARPYPVRGLYRLDDFPHPPPLRPMHIRIPHIHDAWPVVPGTLSVVTGYAGQGKTSLILACMADLMDQGVSVTIGSFETLPRPILENALRGHLIGKSSGMMSDAERAEADAILAERLTVIAQMPDSDEAEMNLDDVLDLAATAVLRDSCRVVLLDPWNEIEHKRRPDESETEYTGRAIRAMKRFARRYDVALILVAHPRKPETTGGNIKPPSLYDISGSANWANKADYGIVIYRPDRDQPRVKVDVTKVRMGLPGRMGSFELVWDWRCSRYERAATVHDLGE